MKNLPVYQNLDTSFVNLSALIRFLRDQKFNGRMQIRLSGYEAEITFGADDQFNVLEHDRVAGRIAEGDEALQRILIRARGAGGTINVFEAVEESEPIAPEVKTTAESPIAKPISKPFSEKEPAVTMPAKNGNGNSHQSSEKIPSTRKSNDFLNLVPENHQPLPLEFTNRVENRARQTQISAEEWQTLLQIVGELYGAVEDVLKSAGLDFPAMLTHARAEISDDYPFLNPASGAFFYKDGTAELSATVSAKLFTASINEVLRRVLERLADDPHHSEVYRDAAQKILALVHHHQTLYDKFSITPQLKKILGV